MKKLSIFLLALLSGAGTMFASDTSVDGIWYNFDDGNLTAEVTYRGDEYDTYADEYSGEVIIPASVTYNAQTYTVTSIGSDAFYGCSSLTSVTIPNSITSIGDWAFGDCTGLTSVTIPNSVTSIGNGTFEGCSGLTSVTIPNSVTNIESSTFEGCFGLTSVTIPSSVTSIGSYAFSECSGLTSVMISDMAGWCAIRFGNYYGNPLYYADNLYLNGTLVTNLVIPEGVTNIGNYAFDGFSGIISVTIPNSVTSIGEYAFGYCSGLTSVTIPNSVTSIGREAFRECTGLTSVTNYATTPQSIISNVFEYVNKSTCILNVPKKSVSLYQATEVWKEFTNIVGVDVPGEDPEIETVEGDYTINYVDKDSQALYNHVVTLYVPVAPAITGFTFLKWVFVGGDLIDTITIQAVYQANTPTNAPAVYTNPANPAQKLIKNGNVYILTDDKTYTITGQQVK